MILLFVMLWSLFTGYIIGHGRGEAWGRDVSSWRDDTIGNQQKQILQLERRIKNLKQKIYRGF